MRFLLLHQNFPGQFRQLVPHLLENGHEVVAVCSHQRPLPTHPSLRILRYTEPSNFSSTLSYGASLWADSLSRAELVGQCLFSLKQEGWNPDRVLAHCGWGEALPVKDVWKDVPLIVWPELWLQPQHLGYGSDPLLGNASPANFLSNLGRNALAAASLARADAWILPTNHQASSFPSAFQGSKMHVIHEGIDVNLACPNYSSSYQVRGIDINRNVPTITFINRNLERLRGFDMFMRSLPLIQAQHPTVRTIIVGDNEAGYGGGHPSGLPLKDVMLNELGDSLDLSRLHFLGRIPHSSLIPILQASTVHVYLSYPFILGWSLLEAMSCGCSIVASSGMPVEEVIHDGVEGLLVSMDDQHKLANRVLALLGSPTLRYQLGSAARRASAYWDQSVTLPSLMRLLESF